MTERQLQKLCQRWQKVLRLQDWTITIRFAERRDFRSQTSIGETNIDFNNKIARVKILNAEDMKYEYPNGTQPVAAIVIHELVHLHVETPLDIPEHGLARTILEQGIEALALAYYGLAEALAMRKEGKK